MKKLLQLLLGVISHLLLTSPSLAQENAGTIYGSVLTESNEAMPLSTVVLLKDSEITAGIITDDEGSFILGGLKPGVYNLKISSVGFSSVLIRNISVLDEEIHIPPVQLNWRVQLSSIVYEAIRPFCSKPCRYNCIWKSCVPAIEFKEPQTTRHVGTIRQVDTLNYLSLESWRGQK